jgi:hypothetical protein
MADLYIVAEGYGEQGFLRECVAPHLGAKGVYARAALVGQPGHKGGVRPWSAVRKDIANFLKMARSDRLVHVSMMFDYFRLPSDWPGRAEAVTKPMSQRAVHVEQCLAADIAQHLETGFWPNLFVPYVQMHELEALLLAEPHSLAAEFLNQDAAVEALAKSVAGIAPEEINDGPATAPSKRIINHLPEYEGRKAQAAVNVLYLTGLTVLRSRCPHFNQWLTRLEGLSE